MTLSKSFCYVVTTLVLLKVIGNNPRSMWMSVILLEEGILIHLDEVWLGHGNKDIIDIPSHIQVTRNKTN